MKIGLDKVAILSAYLHDAGFKFGDITFDQDKQKLTVILNRIYHEEPKTGKFLFFIPVVRFRNIKSRLSIVSVEKIEYEWQDDAFNAANSFHTLLSIDVKDNIFHLSTEYMVLKARLNNFKEINIEDISEPSRRFVTTDFTKSIFNGLDELKA